MSDGRMDGWKQSLRGGQRPLLDAETGADTELEPTDHGPKWIHSPFGSCEVSVLPSCVPAQQSAPPPPPSLHAVRLLLYGMRLH